MENCLDGLIFVSRGGLESTEREREAADLIKRYGGKVTQSVSKKTSYVMVGQDPGEHKLFIQVQVQVHCNTQIKKGKQKQKNEH